MSRGRRTQTTLLLSTKGPMRNLVVALLLSALAWPAAVDAQVIAISADRLIDVASGKVVQQPIVIVSDGRITAAGPRSEVQVPAAARRLDLPGMTLLPGLIDMHVHLDSDPSYGGYTGLQFNDRFWSVLTVPHAMKTLQAASNVRNRLDAWNDVGLAGIGRNNPGSANHQRALVSARPRPLRLHYFRRP